MASRHEREHNEKAVSSALEHMPFVPQQTVLVLQGGGALGAYQCGVYQALHEAGIEPDWIIGTSIGAINGALIAGNKPSDRLTRLRMFWQRMTQDAAWRSRFSWPALADTQSYWMTLFAGVPNFFEPNPLAFLGTQVRLGADSAGYYSTAPLRRTLAELLDLSLTRDGRPRLTVGAAHVRTGVMRYFDSRDEELTINHVMASGALPPAFPPVRIDGELFWDGGILSNTPAEAIFDDNPRRDSLVFAVHMWQPTGPEPQTIWDVLHRHKDIQYSSRVASHIQRQRQLHRLRHVISELVMRMPAQMRRDGEVAELAEYGCLTRMHVIRLLAPRMDHESHTKDVDFSAFGIRQRWDAGYADTSRALAQRSWEDHCDPLEGVILHEVAEKIARAGMPMAAE